MPSKTVFMLVAATCLGGLMTGCESNDSTTQVTWQANGTPFHHDAEQDWWHYQFVYYPNKQVYFEPFSQTYYWYDISTWHEGTQLPQHITVHGDTPQVVKLKAELPFYQHDTVVAHFSDQPAAMMGSTDWDFDPILASRQMMDDEFNSHNPEHLTAAPAGSTWWWGEAYGFVSRPVHQFEATDLSEAVASDVETVDDADADDATETVPEAVLTSVETDTENE